MAFSLWMTRKLCTAIAMKRLQMVKATPARNRSSWRLILPGGGISERFFSSVELKENQLTSVYCCTKTVVNIDQYVTNIFCQKKQNMRLQ